MSSLLRFLWSQNDILNYESPNESVVEEVTLNLLRKGRSKSRIMLNSFAHYKSPEKCSLVVVK